MLCVEQMKQKIKQNIHKYSSIYLSLFYLSLSYLMCLPFAWKSMMMWWWCDPTWCDQGEKNFHTKMKHIQHLEAVLFWHVEFRLTSRHLIDLRELVLLHLLRMYLTLHQLVSKCVCQLCSVFSPHSRFSRRSSPLIKRLLIDEALPSTCCSTLLFVWWSSKNSSLHDPRPPTHGCE